MKTNKDRFLLISNGNGWTLMREDDRVVLRNYSDLDEDAAILKSTEYLRNHFTVIYVKREKRKLFEKPLLASPVD